MTVTLPSDAHTVVQSLNTKVEVSIGLVQTSFNKKELSRLLIDLSKYEMSSQLSQYLSPESPQLYAVDVCREGEEFIRIGLFPAMPGLIHLKIKKARFAFDLKKKSTNTKVAHDNIDDRNTGPRVSSKMQDQVCW